MKTSMKIRVTFVLGKLKNLNGDTSPFTKCKEMRNYRLKTSSQVTLKSYIKCFIAS